MGTNIYSFIIVLGVLITFHELGHFIIARLFGVGVEAFSIGFGPRIFGKKVGLTEYKVAAIPLGGYVKMVGESPDSEIDPDLIPLSFTHKHVFKRICIVAAGPIFNLLLAVLIFWGILFTNGVTDYLPVIGGVGEGTPAYTAGLQEKDRITEINGVSIDTWSTLSDTIMKSEGSPLNITIDRSGERLYYEITPEKKEVKDFLGDLQSRYLLGISSTGEDVHISLSLFGSFKESLYKTYFVTDVTFKVFVRLIQGKISADNLGGPIMIAKIAGEQAKEGFLNLIHLIAGLSINLAILNLLPIPVLDGGHIMFFLIEAITRRPVSLKIREKAQQAGMMILLALMIFVFYNDITRLFQ